MIASFEITSRLIPSLLATTDLMTSSHAPPLFMWPISPQPITLIAEGTVWKRMNVLGVQDKSCLSCRGSGKNGGSSEGPSKNLVPELLPEIE
ncbi:hypothetical protein TNCV_4057011 [Trichonephila clavipes]|nr:hypothetical protein TNCV_4057011 [Trichonephila clavipes]